MFFMSMPHFISKTNMFIIVIIIITFITIIIINIIVVVIIIIIGYNVMFTTTKSSFI